MKNLQYQDKKTICHVINSFDIGGAEILLKDILLNFNSNEFSFVVVYVIGDGPLIKNINFKYPIYNLSNNGRFTFKSFFQLIKILKKEKVSAIHTHDPQSGILARIAAKLIGVKFVFTTRHNPDLIGRFPFIYSLENYLLKNSNGIVVISNAVKEALISKYKINESKITLVYNSIDLEFFKPSHKKINEIEFVIGTICRLTQQKGIDLLIQSFYKFINKNKKDVQLVIAGEGPEKENLLALTSSLSLNDKVKFIGALQREDVRKTLYSLDVFVLASRWEGFGISLIEAMACGVPVIGSNVDGISEIIEDGVNGLLFEPNNIDSLCEKLESIYNDNSLRDTLSKNGVETVRKNYSIDVYCNKLENFYRKYLNQ